MPIVGGNMLIAIFCNTNAIFWCVVKIFGTSFASFWREFCRSIQESIGAFWRDYW